MWHKGSMNIHLQKIQNYDGLAVPVCPTCKMAMRLFGIETDAADRTFLSFDCSHCDHMETTTSQYH
jgi:hypothetical protein